MTREELINLKRRVQARIVRLSGEGRKDEPSKKYLDGLLRFKKRLSDRISKLS